jgi:hypothetical protein
MSARGARAPSAVVSASPSTKSKIKAPSTAERSSSVVGKGKGAASGTKESGSAGEKRKATAVAAAAPPSKPAGGVAGKAASKKRALAVETKQGEPAPSDGAAGKKDKRKNEDGLDDIFGELKVRCAPSVPTPSVRESRNAGDARRRKNQSRRLPSLQRLRRLMRTSGAQRAILRPKRWMVCACTRSRRSRWAAVATRQTAHSIVNAAIERRRKNQTVPRLLPDRSDACRWHGKTTNMAHAMPGQ